MALTYSPGEMLVMRKDGTQWEVTGIREDARCDDGVAYCIDESHGKRRMRYLAAGSVPAFFDRAPSLPRDPSDPGPILDLLVQGLRKRALSLIFAAQYVDAETEAEFRAECQRYVAAIDALGGDGTAELDDAVERAQDHWADRG